MCFEFSIISSSIGMIWAECVKDKTILRLRPESRETIQLGYLVNLMLTNHRAGGM